MRRDRHSVNVEGTFWAAEDALRPCQEELVVRIPSRAEIFERVYAIIGEKVIFIVFFIICGDIFIFFGFIFSSIGSNSPIVVKGMPSWCHF